MTLIARRFVAQDPYWEFRLFVSKGRLTAASAYHTCTYCAAVAAKQSEIAAYLTERVFPALAPRIPRAAYTMDVFLSPSLGSFMLVELNPPPPVAHSNSAWCCNPIATAAPNVGKIAAEVAIGRSAPTHVAMAATTSTVGAYLIRRLRQLGVTHAFGVAGDFAMSFLEEVEASDLQFVGTCNELNASYAADGYARIKGLGALITTHAVGDLSALNGIAGAFSESVPVVMISGAPPLASAENNEQLHHTLGDYRIPQKIFSHVTACSVSIEDPATAPEQIDAALRTCIAKQKPVFISLPTDIVHQQCAAPSLSLDCKSLTSDPAALKECVDEAVALANKAKKPAILVDGLVARCKAMEQVKQLINKSGFPFATPFMGKALVDEDHPQHIGLYAGERSREYVRERIEGADLLIHAGPMPTDFNTGGFTQNIDTGRLISAYPSYIEIKRHKYENVTMSDFLVALAARLEPRPAASMDITPASSGCVHKRHTEFMVRAGEALTVARIFDRLALAICEQAIVVVDTGVSLWSAAETQMPRGTSFIAQIYYGSIGYSVGAALGAAFAAPNRPLFLIVGDGSFQLTGQEISTFIRHKLNCTVMLLNNDGYSIERFICDGKFNNIQSWKYHALPTIFGGSMGSNCYTEDDFDKALTGKTSGLRFVEAHTDRMDGPASLKKAGAAMSKKNRIKG